MCSQLSHNFILCPPHITSPDFTSPPNSNPSASHRIMTLQNPKSTCDVYSTTAPQRMKRVSVSPTSSSPEASRPSTVPSEPWYKHDPLRPTTEDILRTRSKRQRVAIQQGYSLLTHCISKRSFFNRFDTEL